MNGDCAFITISQSSPCQIVVQVCTSGEITSWKLLKNDTKASLVGSYILASDSLIVTLGNAINDSKKYVFLAFNIFTSPPYTSGENEHELLSAEIPSSGSTGLLPLSYQTMQVHSSTVFATSPTHFCFFFLNYLHLGYSTTY